MFSIALPRFAAKSARRAPSLLARVMAAHSVARQRKALSELSDAQLADIGLTRAEADREAARPAWDAPQHWTR